MVKIIIANKKKEKKIEKVVREINRRVMGGIGRGKEKYQWKGEGKKIQEWDN